jgi:hypothetical protein
MSVEEEQRIPGVERAVEAVALDGCQLDSVAVEVEPFGVLAHAQDVRRLAAEIAVPGDAGVGAVHL